MDIVRKISPPYPFMGATQELSTGQMSRKHRFVGRLKLCINGAKKMWVIESPEPFNYPYLFGAIDAWLQSAHEAVLPAHLPHAKLLSGAHEGVGRAYLPHGIHIAMLPATPRMAA